ncbi:LysM peptidoglycan-binding domain-containing protein [Antarctobacter heliothermus]|uniref:LysM domain-containing protein n=1 Tax=Antarctobacter heliothermus TaxID=74033 RepID=A0A239CUL5_9RHOB|nr:LysM peptidoglycan-binding domain-containing protein [Antarctobacter heliothermus]SNS23767.1 LysM domain-containing protein [Antarctobacter heliothermus]
MIRMVLLALGFAVVTVALLVAQPGAFGRSAERSAPEPVTRAEPAAIVVPVQPVKTSVVADRGLGYPAGFAVATEDARPVPGRTVADPAGLADADMRRMTWDALSNLNIATGRDNAPGQPGSLLHTIVQRSLGGAPAAPVVRSPVPEIYVVQQGDSLVSIAERVYGDVNMTGPLFAANQSVLRRPDDLRPGQNLILPQN